MHHAELDFKDLLQVLGSECLEDHDLVDAVHELRGELAASGLDGRAADLVIQLGVEQSLNARKTDAALHQAIHLGGTQV